LRVAKPLFSFPPAREQNKLHVAGFFKASLMGHPRGFYYPKRNSVASGLDRRLYGSFNRPLFDVRPLSVFRR
jgi:hypothetical protein